MNAVINSASAYQEADAKTEMLRSVFVEPADWDQIAIQFRDVLHEQTQCFNALRWDLDKLDRIAFYRDGKLVSAAVVLKIRFPIVGSGIAVCKWGPLWRPMNGPCDPRVLRETLETLKRIYAHEKGFFLSFFPRADPEFAGEEINALVQCGFHPGEELASPDRYFVNTSVTLGELRTSFSQKWRYNLKQAEQNNLTASFIEGNEGYEAFIQLYEAMLHRKQFHDTSAISTLKALIAAKEPQLRPAILIVQHQGKPIAGGVVDISGERAVYLYGATNNEALPLKAGYIMHWEIAKYLINTKTVCWYDLGGADTDCHLHQFKKGLVGKKGQVTKTPSYFHYGATRKARILGHGLYFVRRKKGEMSRLIHEFRRRWFTNRPAETERAR